VPIKSDSIEHTKVKLHVYGREAQLDHIPSNDGRCYWWWRYLMDCAIGGVFQDAVLTLDYMAWKFRTVNDQ
jgi:hypothetical protein